MKVLIKTLGCRLNQAESRELGEALEDKGFSIVEKDPDLIVVNSCSVTHGADRDTRQLIRKLKRANPQAKIAMMGCSDFELEEIDYYFKNKETIIDDLLNKITPSPDVERGKGGEETKTRVNIKIQTGCDSHCTYCVTRLRRGKSISRDPKKIIEQIKEKVKEDCREVVITGVNIGQYKWEGLDLADLLLKILQETMVERIRLSSIDPEYVYDNKKFLDLFKDLRMCPHLHLSLQAGSEDVLKRMNRNYTSEQYLEIVKSFYKDYPLFGFTTDVIVGFPGETEMEFAQTCEFVRECRFLKIHIFRYSPREGTPAATMPDQVDEQVKIQRSQKMQEINEGLQKSFKDKMFGQIVEVLFESKKDGQWFGYAGNYYPVYYKSEENLENKVIEVAL